MFTTLSLCVWLATDLAARWVPLWLARAQRRPFLEGLSVQLDPLAAEDMAALKALKQVEEGGDGVINMWDFRYYLNRREENEYSVNHEEIKQYFPLPVSQTQSAPSGRERKMHTHVCMGGWGGRRGEGGDRAQEDSMAVD